jgi:uncharacterized protein (TIGR03437 family)
MMNPHHAFRRSFRLIAGLALFASFCLVIFWVTRYFKPAPVDSALQFNPPEIEEHDDAEGRLDWFFFQRAYPFDDVPEDGRRRAWLARPRSDARAAQQVSWVPLGPAPTESAFPNNWGLTSGRINAVAVSPSNPDLILVGAATGGIWRSTNGGASFVPVTDAQIDLAVGSIVFAPSNHNIVYAGLGDPRGGSGSRYYGSGVLKSTDGGQTWTRINNATLRSGSVSRIAVSPANADEVYVAQFVQLIPNNSTGNFAAGFYRSTDGGVNWTRTLPGLARDLALHPTVPGTLYLGMSRVDTGGLLPGVYRSTDNGATWSNIYPSPYTTPTNVKVATTPADPRRVYVLIGGSLNGATEIRVELSADNGESFTNLGAKDVDTGQFGYNCYLEISPTDVNTIYLGTRDVYKSVDGGQNYTNTSVNFTGNGVGTCTSATGCYHPSRSRLHPDQHALAFAPGDPNSFYAANDGGLWRSLDGGATFQNLNASLALTQFVGVTINPFDPAISYGGTQDNGTQRRLAGANGRWREFSTGDGGRSVVNPLDPAMVFTTYIRGSITRWTNNGLTRSATVGTEARFGEPATGARIAFYPPFVGNGVNNTLYFGTWRLFTSTDNGNTWVAPADTTDLTKGGSDVLSAIGVSRTNPKVIYTGSAQGGARVSQDGGTTWTDITAGLPNRSITSVTVHPTNPQEAWLTVSGYNTGHIFKTTDAGANWQDVSGNLPNIPTSALLFDPLDAHVIYVGTDIGVLRGTASGANWNTFNNGLPPVVVTSFSAQAGGRIQLSTYGRGAYELAGNINANASVSAANYQTSVTANSIVAAFGERLAANAEVAATLPLPTTLGGVTITVRDLAGVEHDAPLFFVSPRQVNYLMPAGVVPGSAVVTINHSDGARSSGMVYVTTLAPGLFSASSNGQGVAAAIALRIKADGAQVFEPLFVYDAAQNRFTSVPVDVSDANEQVFAVFFGTGFGGVRPLNELTTHIGGQTAEVLYAGPQGNQAGLDQLNVRLPRTLTGRGEMDVVFTAGGRAANVVRINVK